MSRITPTKYLVGITNVNNTLIGVGSIRGKGIQNIFVGVNAGLVNTANNNTFVGYGAGFNNTIGASNVFVGNSAGYGNISGSQNVFIGNDTGFSTQMGDQNVFVGFTAGFKNTIGDSNTFIGYSAGHENVSGLRNVFVGFTAGFNETSSNKLYIANDTTTTPLIGGDFLTSGFVGVTINKVPIPASTFDVAGSQSRSFIVVTTSTQLDRTHFHVNVDTTSGNRTINLPSAATTSGRTYYIQKAAAGNDMVVAAQPGDAINGVASKTTATLFQTMRVMSDGLTWVGNLLNAL